MKINHHSYMLTASRYFSVTFLIATLIVASVNAQQGNPLVLAEKYYAQGEYYTAAYLYEQYLSPSKKYIQGANFPLNAARNRKGGNLPSMSKAEVLYKLAHSYRQANYWPEAAAKYLQLYEKDSIKYADAMYWYAVCKRSLGEYTSASQSLGRYKANGNGTSAAMKLAGNETKIIEFIVSQSARPDSVLYQLKKINTSFGNEKGVYAATAAGPNRYIVTSTVLDTPAKTGINPYHNRLFNASLDNGTLSIDEKIDLPLSDINYNQGASCISADGKTVYFTQWKKDNGKNHAAIYTAIRTANGWGTPQLIPLVNTNGYESKQPFITADGTKLFFASDKPGGAGGFDIWYATLENGKPVTITNAGSSINTEADEQAPFYHAQSNTLVFASNGKVGMGGYDLFASKWNNGQWTEAMNLGKPVNSSRDDIYYYAGADSEFMKGALLSSDRGSSCCLETYTITKLPKKKIITGFVRDIKTNEPVADAVVVMTDNKGGSVQTTTTPEGKFSFEYTGDASQNVFNVTKDKYKPRSETVNIESNNETDWLTDYVFNTPVLIEKKLVIKPETVVTVYFDFDKYDLKQRSMEVLDSIYTVLSQTTTASIQISGYTDGLGSDEYNKILSDRRAKACADYLIAKGIDAGRITFESFGECCPVEMELINGKDNPDGRSKNRRALINITME